MSRILYWPGMGQDLKILEAFRNKLEDLGNEVYTVNFKYDEGQLNPKEWDIINENKFDWWIGLSLGASLLYYSYEMVKNEVKPQRMTIINPFSSRELLSQERNFSLVNQWNFSPIKSKVDVQIIDLVKSIYDYKIPSHHGFELINKANAKQKNIILVDDNHTIDHCMAQEELARILMNKVVENEESNYCNIYKQYREI